MTVNELWNILSCYPPQAKIESIPTGLRIANLYDIDLPSATPGIELTLHRDGTAHIVDL
jgi:hypothetical protein